MQMRPKTKYPPRGRLFRASCLLTGEAELAVQQKPELLHVAGAEIVGFLPGDLNMVTEFVAGIMPSSKNADAAKALIENAAIAGGKSGVPRQGSRSGLNRYVANVNADALSDEWQLTAE